MGPDGRRKRSLLSCITILNLIFILLLLVSEIFIAERHWLTTLFTYAPQQLFTVPTILLLVISIVLKRKRELLINSALFVFCLFVFLGFNIPFHPFMKSGGTRVHVMTYNIHHALGGVDNVVEVIKQQSPDIVCLQEANSIGGQSEPIQKIVKLLPEWRIAYYAQMVILSRYPIRKVNVYEPLIENGRVFLKTIISVKGKDLSVICLHLNTAAKPESLNRHGSTIGKYLQGSTSIRSIQISELKSIAGKISGPLIIAGDFNTPSRGKLYRRMSRQFKDSFHAAGWGFGYTFNTNIPVMRIDYIFVNDKVCVRKCYVPHAMASDHRPVVAEIEIK